MFGGTRRHGLVARSARLAGGCVLLGVGIALMVRADLGLSPWDVLHQGLSNKTGIPIGSVGILVGLVVLALWVPLRERPGWGTATNVVLVGGTVDATLALAPDVDSLAARWACLVVGVFISGLGTALYIGARLGPGPRDGLMTALSRRKDRSIRSVRTLIELTVLAIGWLLGGSVGVGTALFALAIGPLIQLFLGRLTVPIPEGPESPEIPEFPTPTLTTPAE